MKVNQRKTGVVLSYLSQAVRILSGLIYTPVMLRLLGRSEYGLYQLTASVISYLGLLSFGFSGSYIRFYSKYKATGDEEEIARLNGMFMMIFLSISAVCVCCGAVIIKNVGLIFGDGLTADELTKAGTLMKFMVFNMALSFPNSVFDCCITAHEQFLFQRLINIAREILNPFITLPLLIMGCGSVGMVAGSTFISVMSFGLNAWFAVCKTGQRFRFDRFRFSLLKEMWVFTFFIFLNDIISQVNWNIDKFLLGRFDGTNSVAVYGVAGQINTLYLGLSTAVSGVFTPEVNKIVAESDDNAVLIALFTRIGRIQFILLVLVLSGFWFFGKPFINMWAGEGYGSSYYVSLLLITPVTVPLIQNLGIEIQRAKNMHKTRSVVYFVIAIANLLISIPLVKMYGAVGVAVGTAVSLTVGNGFFMNWYYHNKIKLNMISFWKSIGTLIPALIAPVLFGIFSCIFIKPEGLVQILIVGNIYCMIYCISIFRLGMNDYEKQLVTGVLLRIKKR